MARTSACQASATGRIRAISARPASVSVKSSSRRSAALARFATSPADSSRAAAEANTPLPEFVAKFNPMFPAGEAKYLEFVTELDVPHGEAYLVAINNSLLPNVPEVANPLGVLHKAIIEVPDAMAHRVINSAGCTLPGTTTPKSAAEIERFLTRDDLD